MEAIAASAAFIFLTWTNQLVRQWFADVRRANEIADARELAEYEYWYARYWEMNDQHKALIKRLEATLFARAEMVARALAVQMSADLVGAANRRAAEFQGIVADLCHDYLAKDRRFRQWVDRMIHRPRSSKPFSVVSWTDPIVTFTREPPQWQKNRTAHIDMERVIVELFIGLGADMAPELIANVLADDVRDAVIRKFQGQSIIPEMEDS